MGIHISLHSSNWNQNESSEKKKKKNKHLAKSMTGDKSGGRETLISRSAKSEG